MIVDFHTHVFPPEVIASRERYLAADATFRELYSDPKAKLATAEDLLRSMERAGIDSSVVLGFAWSEPATCSRHNDYLLEVAARSGGGLIPFCTVQPMAGKAAEAEVDRCAGAGARGLGELRPDHQGFSLTEGEEGALLARAAMRQDLPLLFHVSEPVGHAYPGKRGLPLAELTSFAGRWPDVRVVAAHLGGGLPFYTLMPEVRKALANTCFDTAATSLLYEPAVYRLAVDLVGADRVLFGSDFPLLSQATSRRRVEEAGLDARERELVLGANARQLLGLG